MPRVKEACEQEGPSGVLSLGLSILPHLALGKVWAAMTGGFFVWTFLAQLLSRPEHTARLETENRRGMASPQRCAL